MDYVNTHCPYALSALAAMSGYGTTSGREYFLNKLNSAFLGSSMPYPLHTSQEVGTSGQYTLHNPELYKYHVPIVPDYDHLLHTDKASNDFTQYATNYTPQDLSMADTHTWSNDIDSSPFNENWHSIKDGLNPEGTQLVYPPTVLQDFSEEHLWAAGTNSLADLADFDGPDPVVPTPLHEIPYHHQCLWNNCGQTLSPGQNSLKKHFDEFHPLPPQKDRICLWNGCLMESREVKMHTWRHLNSHAGTHLRICGKCNKVFDRDDNAVRHERTCSAL